MKIKVNGKAYPRAHHSQLTLGRIVELQAGLTALGGIGGVSTWGEVQAAAAELLALPVDVQPRHPHWPLFYVLTVWSSMLKAGEDVAFMDILDLSQDDIEFVPDPEDVAAIEAAMKGTQERRQRGKGKAAPR